MYREVLNTYIGIKISELVRSENLEVPVYFLKSETRIYRQKMGKKLIDIVYIDK
jgi:hypothetical protein